MFSEHFFLIHHSSPFIKFFHILNIYHELCCSPIHCSNRKVVSQYSLDYITCTPFELVSNENGPRKQTEYSIVPDFRYPRYAQTFGIILDSLERVIIPDIPQDFEATVETGCGSYL